MTVYHLKNRYTENFHGKYDGVSYIIPAGTTVPMLDFVALHLRNQSVIKDNPVTGEREFKLAILELGDDDTPLTEIPVEVLDRTDMDFRKVKIVDLRSRPIPPARKDVGRVEVTKER